MGLLGGGCAAAAFTRGGCGASLGSAAACRLCRGAPAGRPAAISAPRLRIMRPSENCEARGFAAFWTSFAGRTRSPDAWSVWVRRGPRFSFFCGSGSVLRVTPSHADFDRRRPWVDLGRVGGCKDHSGVGPELRLPLRRRQYPVRSKRATGLRSNPGLCKLPRTANLIGTRNLAPSRVRGATRRSGGTNQVFRNARRIGVQTDCESLAQPQHSPWKPLDEPRPAESCHSASVLG